MLRNGYLSRLIITKENHHLFIREQSRLCHLLDKVFKTLSQGSFVNLIIDSIPPSYKTGYLDDSRHGIQIEVVRDSKPYQVRVRAKEFSQITLSGTTQEHIMIWRVFALSYKPTLGLLNPLVFK